MVFRVFLILSSSIVGSAGPFRLTGAEPIRFGADPPTDLALPYGTKMVVFLPSSAARFARSSKGPYSIQKARQ